MGGGPGRRRVQGAEGTASCGRLARARAERRGAIKRVRLQRANRSLAGQEPVEGVGSRQAPAARPAVGRRDRAARTSPRAIMEQASARLAVLERQVCAGPQAAASSSEQEPSYAVVLPEKLEADAPWKVYRWGDPGASRTDTAPNGAAAPAPNACCQPPGAWQLICGPAQPGPAWSGPRLVSRPHAAPCATQVGPVPAQAGHHLPRARRPHLHAVRQLGDLHRPVPPRERWCCGAALGGRRAAPQTPARHLSPEG